MGHVLAGVPDDTDGSSTRRAYLVRVKIQWRILIGAAAVLAAIVLPGGCIALLVLHVVRSRTRKPPAPLPPGTPRVLLKLIGHPSAPRDAASGAILPT